MKFSIKNVLALCVLFFTCSFLHGDETIDTDLYLAKYTFYENEGCIKVKIVFPVEVKAKTTLYQINNSDSQGVSVQIKNDLLKGLKSFYQLVDVEVHATPSPEKGGVMFEIIEILEKKPAKKIRKDTITSTSKYFFQIDKQVEFRDDVTPTLTVSKNSSNIKYLRFFTKP